MDIITIIHVTLAVTATVSGAIVMSRKKGDIFHTKLGKLFVVNMISVNLTAFTFLPKYGFTIFQPLALWNLVWVFFGYYYAAKKPNKNWLINHFYFMTYAYVGVVATAVARIPLSFGFLPNESAFIAIALVFGISVYFIEKQGKKLRAIVV
jgi:uncharacterized membrane protein